MGGPCNSGIRSALLRPTSTVKTAPKTTSEARTTGLVIRVSGPIISTILATDAVEVKVSFNILTKNEDMRNVDVVM